MINRVAKYDYGPKDPKIDYNRLIFNYLPHPIRMADGAGRVSIVNPEPSPYYNDATPRVEVKEWFRGTSTDKFSGLPPMDGQPLTSETGILITTTIEAGLLRSVPSGAYIEEIGLHLSLVSNQSRVVHPHLTPMTARQRRDTRGSGITIEILDPECKYPTLFTTMGDATYKIIPQRTPTPDKNGVRITRWDATIGVPVVGVYELTALTRGPGMYGVRLYSTEAESVTDMRSPEAIGLLKEAKVILHNAEITKTESEKEAKLTRDKAEKYKAVSEKASKELTTREASLAIERDRNQKLDAKLASEKLDLKSRLSELQRKTDLSEKARQSELEEMSRKRDKIERERTEEQANTARIRDKIERERTEERARLRKEHTDLEEKIAAKYEKMYQDKVKQLDQEREALIKSVQKSTEERLRRTFQKEIDLERSKRKKTEEDARANKHTEKKERWGFFSKVLQVISTAFIVYKTVFT